MENTSGGLIQKIQVEVWYINKQYVSTLPFTSLAAIAPLYPTLFTITISFGWRSAINFLSIVHLWCLISTDLLYKLAMTSSQHDQYAIFIYTQRVCYWLFTMTSESLINLLVPQLSAILLLYSSLLCYFFHALFFTRRFVRAFFIILPFSSLLLSYSAICFLTSLLRLLSCSAILFAPSLLPRHFVLVFFVTLQFYSWLLHYSDIFFAPFPYCAIFFHSNAATLVFNYILMSVIPGGPKETEHFLNLTYKSSTS